MKKRIINKTKLLYTLTRMGMLLLFVFNVIAFFTDKDDSQKSRALFNAVQSFLMFLCTYVPGFIEKTGKVSVPNVMSIVFILFCFSHFVVGEIGELYIKSKVFDSILHALSGSMIAILGFSLIRLLNNSDDYETKLSPLFVSIFVVCFSITIGVGWEIVEFMADLITGSNMQRYSDSVTRVPLIGREALTDTMKDLLLDCAGAIVIAIISYIDLKKRKKHTAIRWFIERKTKLPVTIEEDTKPKILVENKNSEKS